MVFHCAFFSKSVQVAFCVDFQKSDEHHDNSDDPTFLLGPF